MSFLLARSEHMRCTMPSSRVRKTKVLGFGTNDADYVVDPGKQTGEAACPAYRAWMRMLIRCYSKPFLRKNPTYEDVFVCDSWASFMRFREWWVANVVDNWEIDKDLLQPGNRMYSPDSCIFVPPWLNRFLIGSDSARGELPIGVYFHKREKKFRAQLSMGNGVQRTIGTFNTVEEAYLAWVNAKIELAVEKKSDMDAIDPRIFPNVIRLISTKK